MQRLVWRHRFLGSSFIIVSLAALQGCTGNREGATRKQDEAAIDWNSPRMREAEREWQSLWDAYYKESGPDGKVRYVETVESVDHLMQKRLSRQSLRQLAASADMVPSHADDRSRFVDEVLAFMVKAFVDSGDRESLVELLSKRCPSRVDGPELIEYYLAFRGERLKDPILILGEAYAKCQVPETRHIIAASVRRSFADFRIQGNDDAEYVSNAMRWYEGEKDDLAVNPEYPLNETSHGGAFTISAYEAHPGHYDNPPEEREPLFRKGARSPIGDRFLWPLLILTTVTAGAMVAFLSMRAKARRAQKASPVRDVRSMNGASRPAGPPEPEPRSTSWASTGFPTSIRGHTLFNDRRPGPNPDVS